jgi:tRNA threonylcarbamoyl adenosine modification protein YeaZ
MQPITAISNRQNTAELGNGIFSKNTLLIDCCNEEISLALSRSTPENNNINSKTEAVEEIATLTVAKKNQHSEYLITAINEILAHNNCRYQDLSAIFINSGPGSFTAVRIAIAFGQIARMSLQAKILAYNYCELQLFNYLVKNQSLARQFIYIGMINRQYYYQIFDKEYFQPTIAHATIASATINLALRKEHNEEKEKAKIVTDSELIFLLNNLATTNDWHIIVEELALATLRASSNLTIESTGYSISEKLNSAESLMTIAKYLAKLNNTSKNQLLSQWQKLEPLYLQEPKISLRKKGANND